MPYFRYSLQRGLQVPHLQRIPYVDERIMLLGETNPKSCLVCFQYNHVVIRLTIMTRLHFLSILINCEQKAQKGTH